MVSALRAAEAKGFEDSFLMGRSAPPLLRELALFVSVWLWSLLSCPFVLALLVSGRAVGCNGSSPARVMVHHRRTIHADG